jgi:hypothetical protein
MKIEFIKETKVNGDVFYFTNVDGKFADKSLSYDKEKAYHMYQNIVKNKGKYIAIEVMESVEIDNDIDGIGERIMTEINNISSNK